MISRLRQFLREAGLMMSRPSKDMVGRVGSSAGVRSNVAKSTNSPDVMAATSLNKIRWKLGPITRLSSGAGMRHWVGEPRPLPLPPVWNTDAYLVLAVLPTSLAVARSGKKQEQQTMWGYLAHPQEQPLIQRCGWRGNHDRCHMGVLVEVARVNRDQNRGRRHRPGTGG